MKRRSTPQKASKLSFARLGVYRHEFGAAVDQRASVEKAEFNSLADTGAQQVGNATPTALRNADRCLIFEI